MKEDWRTLVLDFLHSILHNDPDQLRRLQQKCRNYKLIDDALFKAGVSAPLLRCVSKPEGRAILEEIHGGECALHASARALVGKAFQQGFYWPTTLRDAQQLVQHWPRKVASLLQRFSPSSQCGLWQGGGLTL